MMRRQTLVIPIALLLAVMAAAGVVLYTMNVKHEAVPGGATTSVVVASKSIPAGTQLDALITDGTLEEVQIPKNYVVPGAIRHLSDLQGTTTGQPVLEGEQVVQDRIAELGAAPGGGLGIPDGYSAFTLELPAAQTVGNTLHRGDHVRVFTDFADKSGRRFAVALVPDVMVLDAVVLGTQEDRAVNALITLAVRPEDAAKLAFVAQDPSAVWLNLLPPEARGEAPPAFGDQDLVAQARASAR
jgi:Flp pilus assembly protein CpaB